MIVTRARLLRRRRRAVAGIAAAAVPVLVLGAAVAIFSGPSIEFASGGGDGEAEVVAGPHDAAARDRPDLLTPEPSRVRPGQVVTLRFPEETSRGACYVLEREVAGQWDAGYQLHASAAGSSSEPSWGRIDAVLDPCPDLDVHGPGPDLVRVPPDAPEGTYRLCTAYLEHNFCAGLVVAGIPHPDAPPPWSGPHHEDAAVDAGVVRVEPGEVRPGREVALTFPQATERQDAFALERRVGDGWTHEWWLGSDRGGDGTRAVPREAGFVWSGTVVDDEGPDRVRIPEQAEPAEYRVCLPVEPYACTPLAVVGP